MSEISHIVKSYEEELQNLNDNLIKMGSLVEKQLSDSMEAIIKVDKEAADNIIKNDAKINDILVTGGGIIPEEDMEKLYKLGVGKLFAPGSSIIESTNYIQNWVEENK